MTEVKVDGRRARGRRTRDAVLNEAVALASVSGLEGLSLAKLADGLAVSKSGLFAHWPTKEDLQLAVTDRAVSQWAEQVIQPAFAAPAGVRRIFALHEARLAFYESAVLPGRCFFFTVQCEFDDRPGRVHDKVAEAEAAWMGFITALVAEAMQLGEVHSYVDPGRVAFLFEAIGGAVVAQSRLLDSATAFGYARAALLDVLRSMSINPRLLPGA